MEPVHRGDVRRTARRGARESMRPAIRGTMGVAIFLTIAQLTTLAGWLGESFPTMLQILDAAYALLWNGDFAAAMGWTMTAWSLTMLLTVLIAVPLGVAIGSLPVAARAAQVPIEILRNLPAVALIPVFMLAAGTETRMKVILALLAALWPTLLNTLYGTRDIDPVGVATARSFRLPRRAVLRWVVIPSIASFVFTGIRISAGLALIVVVGAELVAGSPTGIGSYILGASLVGDTRLVLGASVLAGVLGIAINLVLTLVENRLFAWRHGMNGVSR
ncbi:ABC transporter permease [Streptomyces sp. NPDC055078]